MDVAKGFGAIKSELPFAKREAGRAYLGLKELVEITRFLKSILVSVLGMESLVEVATRLEKRGLREFFRGSGSGICHPLTESEKNDLEVERQQWYWIFEQTRGPTEQLLDAMDEGLDHTMCSLRLGKSPRAPASDLEANGNNTARHLEETIGYFLSQRQGPLKTWLAWKGMDQPSQSESLKSSVKPADPQLHEEHQLQLYILLDMHYSFIESARSILNLVQYADAKMSDGTMKKKRFIIPTWKQMKKWLWASLSREDGELDYQKYCKRSGTVRVYLDDVLQTGMDAEHLPPANTWERFSDKLRTIAHLFGSPESFFGFRVAIATMTVALFAFLRNTQQFYIQQRLIWGSIMIAISMTETAGSGIYGQFQRLLGTAIGMVLSYFDWYIVDAHPAGVIVFVGITMVLTHYLYLRFPTDPVVPTITMATVMLIVGYALQVKKVGIAVSETNGQQYHALYVLSPYRLATVVVGVGVAFFFTNFPRVVSVRTCLRKDLSSFLYLLAYYSTSTYKTASSRFKKLAGDRRGKESLERALEKARVGVLAKDIILLQGMKLHTVFAAWEPRFGGKFPQGTYNKLVEHAQNILYCSALMVSITNSFQDLITSVAANPGYSELWSGNFEQLVTALDSSSHDISSLLIALSSAIRSKRPLPFCVKAPKIRLLTEIIADLEGRLLSTQHVCEPPYSAFAALEVTMALITDDASQMLSETKKLVGELDILGDIVRNKRLPSSVRSIMAEETT
ncbi:hypothetical protein Asppvi_011374 [Aspergillus pseudoviridinutans]|uniref:Integral membrane bound transporter domain-containing protein n=1 Tax=Aspergillus pseudoviridinutans TaxID=1517512 RepID=A0A9P3F0C8_9EURO|nr:uncharacterized protein Asppvi_011374 [Aspergillus pseudoviridinutans]GIJ92392.1 hypothetical protein Asppvi_011374 [Aspergillus pseudoviridinutans]